MITQQDIATRLGVSVTTVSLALRNDSQVSEEMRAQVQAVASELGYVYRPRKTARKGAVRIAFVGRYDATSAFYWAVLHGAEKACQRHNLTLRYVQLEDATHQPFSQLEVDALLMVSSISAPTIRQFKQLGLPIVLIDNNLPFLEVDRVLTENLQSLYRTVVRLAEWGHRHIAFLSGPDDIPSFRDRLLGYRAAMSDLGLAPQEMTCIYTSAIEDQQKQIDAWLCEHGRPGFTALIACNDKTAIGAIYALQQHQIEVPGDVSVVGFDDIDVARTVRPALTTVHVYREMMGVRAIELVLDRLENPSRPAITLSMDTQFVERDSTQPILQRSPAPSSSVE
jgi:DNA-binding LacI/PurR family transcriptional regulator